MYLVWDSIPYVCFFSCTKTRADRFIGTTSFALKGSAFESDDGSLTNGEAYASWLFQWAFAATAATIVSGAVAERVSFTAYVIYSIVLTSFIYPVVVHWGWGEGWASAWVESDLLFDCGVIDFAGSGVVHMTGGVAALCAAIVVGPRIGRFNENGTANTLPQQSAVLQVSACLGWGGWYIIVNINSTAVHSGRFVLVTLHGWIADDELMCEYNAIHYL